MDTTGYSDLDETIILLKKLESDGRIAGVAFEQNRFLAAQHIDVVSANKTLRKQLEQAEQRVQELEGEVARSRKGLEDIQTHIQISVKGKYELSIVYQIAGKALAERSGE